MNLFGVQLTKCLSFKIFFLSFLHPQSWFLLLHPQKTTPEQVGMRIQIELDKGTFSVRQIQLQIIEMNYLALRKSKIGQQKM